MGFPFQPANCGGCGCGPGCPACGACPDFVWMDLDGNPHPMSCYDQAQAVLYNAMSGTTNYLLHPSTTTACVYEIPCVSRLALHFDASVSPPLLTLYYYASGCAGTFTTCGPLSPSIDSCQDASFYFLYDLTSAGCADVLAAGYTQIEITS